MTHRRSHAAAIAARPATAGPDWATDAAGPSDIEIMVSRSFPLGRLRMRQAAGDRPDAPPVPDLGPDAARADRSIPPGRMRDAVPGQKSTQEIRASRGWGNSDY